jgi:hypothetical protein
MAFNNIYSVLVGECCNDSSSPWTDVSMMSRSLVQFAVWRKLCRGSFAKEQENADVSQSSGRRHERGRRLRRAPPPISDIVPRSVDQSLDMSIRLDGSSRAVLRNALLAPSAGSLPLPTGSPSHQPIPSSITALQARPAHTRPHASPHRHRIEASQRTPTHSSQLAPYLSFFFYGRDTVPENNELSAAFRIGTRVWP